MFKKIFLLCLILVLIIGCSETQTKSSSQTLKTQTSSTPTTYNVVVQNGKFNPTDLNIKVGDTVEWVNRDSKTILGKKNNPSESEKNELDSKKTGVTHSVTFEDARLDSSLPNKGTVKYTFKKKGEARYFCRFHPTMRGSIKVS